MADAGRYPIVPPNADKILFAEDFVNHFLLERNFELLSSGISDHRSSIYTGFTLQVKLATDFDKKRLKDVMFDDYMNVVMEEGDINIDLFSTYADSLKRRTLEQMLPIGEGAESLLEFCIKVTDMAAEFYYHQVFDAPALAAEYIVSILDNIDMIGEGGWKALDLIGAEISEQIIDMNDDNLTPGDSNEEESDSESSGTREAWIALAASIVDHGDSSGLTTSSETSTMAVSEDSRSPEHDAGEPYELPDQLTDFDVCQSCIAAMSSTSGEPVPSSSTCRHVAQTIEVETENIASSPGGKLDSAAPGPSKDSKRFEALFRPSKETSSADDTCKRKTRKRRKKKPFYSTSNDSDSDANKAGAAKKNRDGNWKRRSTDGRDRLEESEKERDDSLEKEFEKYRDNNPEKESEKDRDYNREKESEKYIDDNREKESEKYIDDNREKESEEGRDDYGLTGS